MSVTHKVTRGLEVDGVKIEKIEEITSGSEVRISESIPGASTDLLLACVIDISQMRSLYIHCDRAITLEFNSSSVPAPSIALAADVPYQWTISDLIANCKLTEDVTALYVTLEAGAAATLTLRALVDPTV